jgi:hypothetical protein
VPLTQEQIDLQAKKASWYVEIDNRRAIEGGDVYVVTGDGVDDLDRLLSLMPTLQAIRAAYVGFYGAVNKPGYHPAKSRKYLQLDRPEVQL